MADKDLAYQFSGPYVQTFMETIQTHMDEYLPIIEYFYELAIDTAEPEQLAFIGLIVGYPWPAAPSGIFGDNNFVFGEEADFPVIDNLTGFGDLTGSIGGLFSSSNPAIGNLIPIFQYRILLKQVAYLKFHGLTLVSIDKVCQVFGPSYTIDFGPLAGGSDIYIGFITQIGPANLWVIQKIFEKFTTAPQVFVSQE